MFLINLQCLLMDKTIFQSQEALDHWKGKWMLRNTAIVPVGFDKNTLYTVSEGKRQSMRQLLGYQDDNCVVVFSGAISKFEGWII